MTTFKIGDKVTPLDDAGWPKRLLGQTYEVVEVPGGSRKNYKCRAVGGVQGINAPAHSIRSVDALVTPVELVPLPAVGSTHTVQRASRGLPAGSLVVVVANIDATRSRVFIVNGNGSTYWRLPNRELTAVDVSIAATAGA